MAIGGSIVLGSIAAVGALVALAAAPDPHPAGPPSFTEEAIQAGVEHVYDGEFIYFVGGGVAVLDCDDDGFPDLYLAGGVNTASLFRNVSPVGGQLEFVPVADSASALTGVVGAYPLDIDADERSDLVVLRHGENRLLRGVGDCRFEDAGAAFAFDGGEAWTTAFSAKWEDDSALPTLAFGNYLLLDTDGRWTGSCPANTLLRPMGDRYGSPIPLEPGWCTLSVMFTDWDRSGRRDLRVSNDRHYYRDGEEQLWRLDERAPPRLYTAADGWRPLQIFGMGIASADLTGDGLPEMFLTSMGDNKLQTLGEGRQLPIYEDIALDRGVTAHRPTTGDETQPSTAWHPEFADVNNDGFLDLFISKGNVEAMVEAAANDPSNLLLGRPDGKFEERAADAGLISEGRGRGAALVDFNLDGWLDVVEVNRRENVKLWRSLGRSGAANWISLDLAQAGANRDAVGAWVQVRLGDRTWERELTVGGGHAGGQLGWMHFGLGDASAAEVRVQWPDGELGPWLRVAANTFAIIERGADTALLWSPEAPRMGGTG